MIRRWTDLDESEKKYAIKKMMNILTENNSKKYANQITQKKCIENLSEKFFDNKGNWIS
jgi:hypothetical protein